jgi:hypothetical protein
MPTRKKKSTTSNKSNQKGSVDDNNEKKKKFEEPKIKWNKSKAKLVLYEAIMKGKVPLDPRAADEYGEEMALKDIFVLIPELAEYDYMKLSSRLSSLHVMIKEHNYRANIDQKAFDNFMENHPPSLYSRKGYYLQ